MELRVAGNCHEVALGSSRAGGVVAALRLVRGGQEAVHRDCSQRVTAHQGLYKYTDDITVRLAWDLLLA